MTSFAPRAAMTTAEPPAAVTVSAIRIYFPQQIPLEIGGPGGEAFFEYFVYFVDCFVVKNSCAFVLIRGYNSMNVFVVKSMFLVCSWFSGRWIVI
jgi:hypothetical protein